MFRQIETLSLNVQLRKSKCNKDVKKFALIFYPFCTFSPYFPSSCQPSSQQFTLNSSLQLVCSLHSIQGRRNVKNLGRNKTIPQLRVNESVKNWQGTSPHVPILSDTSGPLIQRARFCNQCTQQVLSNTSGSNESIWRSRYSLQIADLI